jgi:hypothetical protein
MGNWLVSIMKVVDEWSVNIITVLILNIIIRIAFNFYINQYTVIMFYLFYFCIDQDFKETL